jgi:hypothetical protein
MPADIAAQYCDDDRKSFHITRGAFEVKTSTSKLSFDAYFVPQVYMEMITLRAVWCDLVRFRPDRHYDAATKQWTVRDKAHVYRVWRDRRVEATFVRLWKVAYAGAASLQTLVQEPEFRAVRDMCGEMARAMPAAAVLDAEKNPAAKAALELYLTLRDQRLAPLLSAANAADEVGTRLQKLARRAAEIETTTEIPAAIAEQIRDYGSLLAELLTLEKGK